MKKILLLFMLIIPFNVKCLSASSYIVMDMDSGRIMEGSNTDKVSLIASITKILTAITAIEYGNLEDIVKIDDSILKSYGSGIYVQVGEELTLDDLLYGLMLRSGNDAALAIASHVGDDVDNFVFMMNEVAKRIGMKDSYFVNPSGLEENDGSANKSTVYDMALLTRYAMNNEHYRRIVSTKEIIVKSSYKTYKWVNKNKLLSTYKHCNGGKTGFTKKAHRTLVTTASNDNMNLIVVTFNDGNDFNDHKNLYEKYFNNYERVKIVDKNDNYGSNLKLRNDFYMIKKEDDKVEIKVSKYDTSNAINGSIGGKVSVILNGKVLGSRNLYYEKISVTKDKGFLSKLIEFLKYW